MSLKVRWLRKQALYKWDLPLTVLPVLLVTTYLNFHKHVKAVRDLVPDPLW